MKKYLCIFCAFICVLLLSACDNASNVAKSYEGSRMGNDHKLLMKYNVFNKDDSQIVNLNEGDVLNVEIVSDSGKVSVVIQKENDKPNMKEKMFQQVPL